MFNEFIEQTKGNIFLFNTCFIVQIEVSLSYYKHDRVNNAINTIVFFHFANIYSLVSDGKYHNIMDDTHRDKSNKILLNSFLDKWVQCYPYNFAILISNEFYL